MVGLDSDDTSKLVQYMDPDKKGRIDYLKLLEMLKDFSQNIIGFDNNVLINIQYFKAFRFNKFWS